MQNDNYLKNYLHLHFIVFIWGFTAVLGKLITLQALDLVWYRMFFASFFLLGYLVYTKCSLKISSRTFFGFSIAGIVIAGHWYTFYEAIKVSNISITLACLSSGAFFTSLLEPLLYRQKVNWLNIFLGLFVIFGLYLIAFATTIDKFGFWNSFQYAFVDSSVPYEGILLAILSAFLSALFSVINGKFAKQYNANVISFYELGIGVLAISVFLLFVGKIETSFFKVSTEDFLWLLVLSTICTAYAFSASVKVMKVLSPFTVMLTINLEPVYGIILALLFFNDSEKMSSLFYVGASIILMSIIINGAIKNYNKKKTYKG